MSKYLICIAMWNVFVHICARSARKENLGGRLVWSLHENPRYTFQNRVYNRLIYWLYVYKICVLIYLIKVILHNTWKSHKILCSLLYWEIFLFGERKKNNGGREMGVLISCLPPGSPSPYPKSTTMRKCAIRETGNQVILLSTFLERYFCFYNKDIDFTISPFLQNDPFEEHDLYFLFF